VKGTEVVSVLGIAGAMLLVALVAAAGGVGSAQVGGVSVFVCCAILALLIQWIAFVPAFLNQTEHYFDLTGSITYISLVLLGLALSGVDARSLLISGLVLVWAGRLGSFLFKRVREDGSDKRFRSIKPDFLRFLMTWTLQGAWVLVTFAAGLAAITSSTSVTLGWLAGIGVTMWLVGFAIEVLADRQKRQFRRQADRETDFITSGLWAWSRHPNYFGEILLWFGIALIALPVLSGLQYLTLISPVFVIVLLTRISGIPMLERRADKRWGEDPGYQHYKRTTPVLLPKPPR
jgi:steroid 5-alpha reductase family enzyme